MKEEPNNVIGTCESRSQTPGASLYYLPSPFKNGGGDQNWEKTHHKMLI